MIRLHHVAQARSFRILWLMEEMGLDFEVARRSFFDKSLDGRVSGDLARGAGPGGRDRRAGDLRERGDHGVPVRHAGDVRARPGDADWVDWLEWLHFAETIGQHLANLTQQHIALREDWMRSPTVMRLEAKQLEKALQVVEAGLGARDWLLASGFSAVDCAVGYGALIGRRVGFEGLPRVAGWLHRCEERPAFRRAMARDGEAEIYRGDFYPAPEGWGGVASLTLPRFRGREARRAAEDRDGGAGRDLRGGAAGRASERGADDPGCGKDRAGRLPVGAGFGRMRWRAS